MRWGPSLAFLCLLLPGLAACQDKTTGQGGGIEARFTAFDNNGDGKLTPEEVSRPALFKRADVNGDGVVTLEEARTLRGARQTMSSNPEEETSPAKVPAAPVSTGGSDVTANIAYATMPGVNPNLLSLDVYSPKGAKGKNLPVMIMIHGGGWRRGDKANPDIGPAKAAFFNGLGYVYVSINYRLSPPVQHPAHVQDAAKALAWVETHIGEYGGDKRNIHLMGHSAGAHLAALVTTDERYLRAAGADPSMIRSVILLDSAAYALSGKNTYGPKLQALYENAFGSDRSKWDEASPLRYVASGKNLPPFLIFSIDQRGSLVRSREFVAGLRQAGVPVGLVVVTGEDHEAVNKRVGQSGDQETALIQEFLAGKDPAKFPGSI